MALGSVTRSKLTSWMRLILWRRLLLLVVMMVFMVECGPLLPKSLVSTDQARHITLMARPKATQVAKDLDLRFDPLRILAPSAKRVEDLKLMMHSRRERTLRIPWTMTTLRLPLMPLLSPLLQKLTLELTLLLLVVAWHLAPSLLRGLFCLVNLHRCNCTLRTKLVTRMKICVTL